MNARRARSLFRLWLGLVAATTAAFASTARADVSALNLPVEHYRLRNGLRVVLAPDPALEDVSVLIRYGVGSADDPDGKDGLAHVVEHLMFTGSRHVRPGDRERWIARAGGVEDGTTDTDVTDYTETAPPEALALILWLESDRMGFLADTLTAEVLDRERHLVVDELRDVHCKRVDAEATGRLEILPDWHPYHRRLCNGDVLGVKLADVRAFLRTWYGPSNATIAIAGRFDSASVRALIDRYFGTLPGSDVPERPALTADWPPRSVRLEVGSPDPQEFVTFVWRGFPFNTRADAALDVAASLLTDPAGSLRRDLDRRHLATYVNAREHSSLRDSIFTLTVGLRDGAAPDDVIAVVDRAVTGLGAAVAPGAFERARVGWSDWTMSLLETSRGRVGRMVAAPDVPEPLEFDSYGALTATDVEEAVRARLVPDRRATVVVHHGHYPLLGVVLSRKTVTP